MVSLPAPAVCGRTPHGVRGLKSDSFHDVVSAPRRTPHGVRGLKLQVGLDDLTNPESHPSRGAWIEIGADRAQDRYLYVAPLTGCVD